MRFATRTPAGRRPALTLRFAALLALAIVATLLTAGTDTARGAVVLLSQGKPAVASSSENAATPAGAAVDGNAATRWSSAFSDVQWLRVDLGSPQAVTQVTLSWEAAYARAFQIQVSNDATTWQTVYSTTTGTGGNQTLSVSGTGRYVRVNATTRATPYGYSLWEFQVFGESGSTTACGTTNQAQGKQALASSTENATFPAGAAVDGSTATRWASAFADPQWLRVDLGSSATVCRVTLTWEAAYASGFQLQTSADGNAWTTIYSTTAGTGGVQTLDVTGTGRYVRMNGTTRATPYGYSLFEFAVFTTGGTTNPPDPSGFWGDTSAIPAPQNVVMVKILNRTGGRYPDSQVFWSYNGQVHSIAERPYFDMPANTAGRMYFHLGSPDSEYWDFIEFTVGPDVFNGNTTRVDAFGLKLAMRLHSRDGYDVEVGEDRATFAEDRAATFQRFADEVPAEFKHLATIQAPYRIPAPGSSPQFRAGGQYADYMTGYAQQAGVNAATSDVFGCANALSEAPQTCAALNRHVVGQSDAAQNDPANYYRAAPANYYAKFWHDHAIDRLSYGFPYDDYAGQSSFVSHGQPQWLLVAVGW
jgi:hypothetical protein